jgi:hypothetical protein
MNTQISTETDTKVEEELEDNKSKYGYFSYTMCVCIFSTEFHKNEKKSRIWNKGPDRCNSVPGSEKEVPFLPD